MNARRIEFAAPGGILLVAATLLLAGCGDEGAPAGRADSPAAAERPAQALPGDSLAAADADSAAGTGTTGGTVATAPRSGSPSTDAPAASRPRPGDGAGAPPSDAGVAGAAVQEGVEEVLRATARRYEGIRSFQADFEQRLTNALLGRTTESAGTLYQRQPDRFLMRFSQPAGDVIVSDGEYFWVYYPSSDAKQVIRSSRGAGGLDLRSQFVGDPVRRFAATSEGTETVRGRATHVLTLTPRERVGYRRLKAWIDAEDHLVRRFELTEENGNVRRFELTDLRVNPTLPDDLFVFEPPAGAVVVSQ
ncbi:MAG TPA: outer membrane lipoprotein carrier protein LolA [Longimicrobiales bacterium]|nr:outer membrane lipoprotein carrier protein LolA [Longimicrobiales bacterium]